MRGPGRCTPRALFLVLCAGALAACSTKRTLLLESVPPGAKVWVDGQERGVTPLEVPFVHPGSFAVRLEKQGYSPLAADVAVKGGFESYPVVDLPYELIVRERHWRWVGHLEALPAKPGEEGLQEVLERAREFRRRTDREVGEAGTPVRSRP